MTSRALERKPEQQSPSPELEVSYEEANVAELKNVLNEFAAGRAGKTREEASLEDVRRGLDDMWQNYALLEEVNGEQIDTEAVPDFTVAIPVAALTEKPETVANTVELIRRSHGDTDGPVEVVVWANAKYEPDTQHDVEVQAKEKYDELVKTLEPLSGNGVVIRTALQTLPREKGRISNIRSNYMDAISIEGVEKGYGYDHPVMWLDADTTFIAKGALKEVTDEVRNFNAYTAHTNQNFTTEWAEGAPLNEMDDATRAVAVNEIVRRKAIRGGAMHKYYEESGLAYTLGVYLKVGGVNTDDPINEAPQLVKRMKDVHGEEMLKVMNIRALTPRSLWKDGQAIPPVFTKTVMRARTGMSGRRHHERVKRRGVSALKGVDIDYADGLYSDMDTMVQHADMPITADDMYTVLNRNRLINSPFKRGDAKNFAHNLVERYFRDHS